MKALQQFFTSFETQMSFLYRGFASQLTFSCRIASVWTKVMQISCKESVDNEKWLCFTVTLLERQTT